MRTLVLIALSLVLLPRVVMSFPLVIARESEYVAFDPATGHTTRVGRADLPFGSTNFQFILDEGARYAFMLGETNNLPTPETPILENIDVTDLLTGVSVNYPQPDVPDFGGFFRGNLVLATDEAYYAFDPKTGKRTRLAPSITEGLNFQFIVDPDRGIAYRLGTNNHGRGVAVTDLATGKSHFIPESGLPVFGGFFEGKLVVAYGHDFYNYDPEMGKGALLASSPLGDGTNFQFSVDSRSGYAYMVGTKDGEPHISSTSLITGESTILNADPNGLLSKLYPEVASLSPRRHALAKKPHASLRRFYGSRSGTARLTEEGATDQAKIVQKTTRFRKSGMKVRMTGTFPDGSRLVTRATFSPGGGYYASILRNGKIVNLVNGSWRLDNLSSVAITEVGQDQKGSFSSRSKVSRLGTSVSASSSASNGSEFGWSVH